MNGRRKSCQSVWMHTKKYLWIRRRESQQRILGLSHKHERSSIKGVRACDQTIRHAGRGCVGRWTHTLTKTLEHPFRARNSSDPTQDVPVSRLCSGLFEELRQISKLNRDRWTTVASVPQACCNLKGWISERSHFFPAKLAESTILKFSNIQQFQRTR